MGYDKDSILNDYIACGITQGESTLVGDYKTGNKAARRLITIYKLLEKDDQLAAYLFDTCFWHKHINVRICAAAHALGLNTRISEATAILRQISREDTGILGFNAERCLEAYGKQGFLKFY